MGTPIDFEIAKAYIESSRAFVQLSSAGLVVPITLNMLDHQELQQPRMMLGVCASWIAFLVSIGAGVLYQYAAIKTVEHRNDPAHTFVPWFLRRMVERESPGYAYGVMVAGFYLGALCLVGYIAPSILAD
jgi:hypothetical protein